MQPTQPLTQSNEPSGVSACPGAANAAVPLTPFEQVEVTITKAELIRLKHRINTLEGQYKALQKKNEELEAENQKLKAELAETKKKLFGKQSEKAKTTRSEKAGASDNPTVKPRGQQQGAPGHGRTPRPHLPIVPVTVDLADEEKNCPCCGLPYQANSFFDEESDVIEVKVNAYIRRQRRKGYQRHPQCRCPTSPVIKTAPPPLRLIEKSPYDISFWVEVMLAKYRYGQPLHRFSQQLEDRGLPVSSGTIVGGLERLAPLFEPVMEAFYVKQMSETLFWNDETRWEVFEAVEGKTTTRWYLWVTRSETVIYFNIDPSRSGAVPGAHFAGLQGEMVIIICDRYSAYKKLARLSEVVVLAFCWAHMRRDFLGSAHHTELEEWVLHWKAQIGLLYHYNRERLQHWVPERALTEQSEEFNSHHAAVKNLLEQMHQEAAAEVDKEASPELSRAAATQQRKVCKSLLEHWEGLTRFVENPQVPLDNNLAENAQRGPVVGRKNYYGSGSIWSASLAAMLFSLFGTLGMWGLNSYHWLTAYLTACAENGGKPPADTSTGSAQA